MTLSRLNGYIDALSTVDDVESIHDVCSSFCQDQGFEHFIYGARIPTSFTQPSYIYISGYPQEWRERYLQQRYLSIDPVVLHCAASTLPIDWNDVRPAKKENRVAWEFMGEVRAHGLNSGASFPVHTARGESALLSLANGAESQRSRSLILTAMPQAQLFSIYLHEAVRRVFAQAPFSLARIQLTEREKQCLLWAAEGKSTWETAQILKISERTVVFHVQNAAEKLNVVNRQQAVARAVSNGLISPQFN